MQRITRARLVLSLALVGALALAGCGGDDAYSISAEDQARIDMLTDDLTAANKKAADDLAAMTQAEADLKTAQGEIDSLTAQIGMEGTDDMAATGLHKQLADARVAAAMAQTTIGQLTDTIGMMPGDDGMGGSGLQGDLAMYKATAADLEMQIGAAPGDDGMGGSGLEADLAKYKGMVADLEMQIGAAPGDDGMGGSGLEADLAKYKGMVADLEMQIGAAPGDDGMGSGLQKQLADAQAMVTTLNEQIGMEATDDMAATGLYKDLADAMAEAEKYKDMVGMEAEGDNPATGLNKRIADAEAQADKYKNQAAELQKKVDAFEGGETKDINAAAQKMKKSIYDDIGQSMSARFVESGLEGDSAGTEILKLMADRAMKDDDTMLDEPHAIEGWNGMSWSRDLGGNDSETAVVYNNQTASADKAFNKVYTLEAIADEGTALMGAYTLMPTNDGKHIMVDGLPAHPSHDAKMIGKTNGVRGTFRGVAGVFKSTGNSASTLEAVSVGVTADGVPTWPHDDSNPALTFTPDEPMEVIMEPGKNYVSLGWWLRTNKMADGTLEDMGAKVRVRASSMGDEYDGSDSTGAKNFIALTGKATFMGIAAGKYAYKTTTTAGTTAHEAGHFTADAKLTANFMDTGMGNLMGTISGFEEDGESMDWKVDLADDWDVDASEAADQMFSPMMGKALEALGVDNVPTAAPATTPTGSNAAMANGARLTVGDATVYGAWQARFVDGSRKDNLPGAVVGEFAIGNMPTDTFHMLGAFGAANQVADQQ